MHCKIILGLPPHCYLMHSDVAPLSHSALDPAARCGSPECGQAAATTAILSSTVLAVKGSSGDHMCMNMLGCLQDACRQCCTNSDLAIAGGRSAVSAARRSIVMFQQVQQELAPVVSACGTVKESTWVLQAAFIDIDAARRLLDCNLAH